MSNETPGNRHYNSAKDSSLAVQGGGHERSSDAAAESDADESSMAADDAPPTITTAAAAANDDDYHISNNTTVNDSSSAVAKGLSIMLSSVIRDLDSRAEDTVRSQDQLSFSIDRLTRELDQLLEDAPLPFIMQHAVKISGVRKRVSSLNIVLKSIQQRLDNVDRMLSVGLPHEKAATKDVGHQ